MICPLVILTQVGITTRRENHNHVTIQRGEDCPPRTDTNIDEYFKNANSWEEYCYVYTLENEWMCYEITQKYNEDYSEVIETITVPRTIPEDVEKATAGAVSS